MKDILYNLFFLTLILTFPLFVEAQGIRQIVTCDVCNFNDLTRLIDNVLRWIFIFANFIVAIMFMYAGFLLMTAAGNQSQIQKAKTVFRRVLIGFIILFAAVLIVTQLLKVIGANTFFQGIITR